MKRQKAVVLKGDGLRHLVSGSKVLDPNVKRYWLSVLDHLTPASRERLKAILTAEGEETDVGRGLVPRL